MRLEDFKARNAQEGFAVDIAAALASFDPSVKQFLDHDPRRGAGSAPGGKGPGQRPGQRLAELNITASDVANNLGPAAAGFAVVKRGTANRRKSRYPEGRNGKTFPTMVQSG